MEFILQQGASMNNEFFVRSKPAIAIRGIHLDLKGLPPTSGRLFELLEILAEARINCIVVEWEDMYPWKTYPELKNETAYTESTVKKFVSKAASLGIEVIPLVQSFGHMENVLSKRRFKHLREIPDNVSDLCPLKTDSRDIVLQMIKDVLLTHTGIKHFHLGGDEVWSFGSCSACKKFIEKHGKASLYLYHLEPLLQFLNERDIRPIIWDDMIRTWNISEVKKIGKQADLMCWSYGIDPFKFVTRETIDKFMNAGCNLWAASAFKGADGAYVDIPYVQARIANMLAWVKCAETIKMKGVVATGWSRYNTFVSPCEGLEASLDTLVLAGKIAWDSKIPDDISEWVDGFLKFCEKKGIRTAHFSECRRLSEQLQNLRNSAFACARNFLQQAHLAGEPERINPFRTKDAKRHLLESLKNVRKVAKQWEKVHRTLVPSIWLKKYTLSRIEPVKKLIDIVYRKSSSSKLQF